MNHVTHVHDRADGTIQSGGIMRSVESDELLSSWERVLDTQTHLFGPQEVGVLDRRGIGACSRGILEVGSGNGDYGLFLSSCMPEVPVYGVEANPGFIERFRRRVGSTLHRGYSIDLCKVGDDPLPVRVRGQFDACLLRLVLQHVSNPVSVLGATCDALPRGGRIFVIEEDDRFFQWSPGFHAFERVVDIWRRVCAAEGTDSSIGSRVPHLLRQSGFEVESADVLVHNSMNLGHDFDKYMISVLKMFQLTSPHLVSQREIESIEDEFSIEMIARRGELFGTYTCVITSGIKR